MHLHSAMFSLAALLAVASARPAVKHVLPMSTPAKVGKASSNAVGAAYFMTNEVSGNFLVSADVLNDGSLRLSMAISTNGRGLHGATSPPANGPDGLFSQGAVKASAKGQFVAAVNPGSNTISMFTIDPANPSQLTSLGGPVSSEGEFPMSLAVTEAGDRICVLNGGAVAGVNCYAVDKNAGLTAIPGSLRALSLNQTTPPAGPAGTASHVVFNEAQTQLMASIKGAPPTPGFLAIWDVAANGSLSEHFAQVSPPAGGLLPFGMTVIPGQNAVLVTDAGVGFDIFDLNANATAAAGVNSTVGGASTVNKVDGQVAVCWSSRSNKTGNFYLTDIGTSQVTEVNVDDNLKPTIVKQYEQTTQSATIDTDIASVGGNDFLYIMAPNATQVQVMSLNAPGQAKQMQTLDISGPAQAVGLTVSPSLQGMATFVKA